MINKFLTIVLILTGTALFGQQQGKYFFTKSGHIEYTLGGNWTGTKSIWFDDYGMLMRTLTESTSTVTVAGFTSTTAEKKLEIRKGKDIWVIDLLTNTGSKSDIGLQTGMGRNMTQGKSDEELHQMERKIITDMGATITGYETFLGKKCLMFTWGTTKFSQYKGIPLKSEVTQTGVLSLLETAVSFEENISVPASKFEIPDNIEFQQSGGLSEVLKGLESSGEYQEQEENGTPPGLSYERFEIATKSLNIPGFPYFMSDNSGGIYLTSYAKSETEQIIIFMENEGRFYEMAQGGEGMIVESTYSLDGHDAVFINITHEDDGTPTNSRSLLVRMPEHQAVLYIIASLPKSKSELEGIIRQIRL
ncbi:MAG: hypothetical protein IPH20_13005 [Bacteroidales bacterium]|nr:hypothetical protein [Bacteroidales bacterium]